MENKKHKTKTLNSSQGALVVGFFTNAYGDYLAARTLLINRLLIQGCIMANTAIEKYFKGMIAMLDEPIPRHHDIATNKFRNTLQNKYPSLFKQINLDFVTFLSKSYRLRYYDEVEDDFSLAIVRGKTLAELDYTVSKIEEGFEIKVPGLQDNPNKYRADKSARNPLLWQYHYLLNAGSKSAFIEQQDWVYEFRKGSPFGIMEVLYQTDFVKDDGIFLYDALQPQINGEGKHSFTCCFMPRVTTS